jgi:hypothetical protein
MMVEGGHASVLAVSSHIPFQIEATEHSTSEGYRIGKQRNTGSMIWQAMSPSEPVPYAHHPLQLNGK